ncbi:MAG: hypothetical protein COA50_07825 [Flavobacteriaceae bacterium]|nr:MAG: hypothetical protein COA50_07825 [Flavobacteriaceae bacterium]
MLGTAQDLAIKNKSEHIIIKKDTSFVKHISVELKKSDEAFIYPIFYDTELEVISNIQFYTKKGDRFKLQKNIFIQEDEVRLDYIASKRVKSIFIPAETEVKVTYSVACKELMYFTDLRFFSYNEIDTLTYQIDIPKTFRFHHNIIYKDSLDYLEIDSVAVGDITKWKVKVAPVKVVSNPLMLFGIYKNMKVPLMRSLIVPVSYEGRPLNYMNDWYLEKVKSRRGLNPTVIQKVNELTEGVEDPKNLMEILYKYVHNNFKYVAIEVGMGAFIPTHANEVFNNKYGDCKDLSNLLSEILNYKGIKSDIAMAATFNHISDCDFPSLSSANHLICVAYINKEPIVLDPTDPIHMPETPVESLQDRTILIINKDGGSFYKINRFSPKQNLIKYEIDITATNKGEVLTGDFKIHYNGISGNFLKRSYRQINREEHQVTVKKFYEKVFGNQSIINFDINQKKKSIAAEGKINIKGKIFNDGDSTMLFIDFIPGLMETESRETLLVGTHLGSNFSKEVHLRITMEDAFETFEAMEHKYDDQGVSLNFKITSPSEFVIDCVYDFSIDYISIEKENLQSTNETLKMFKKIINEPIILEKKK